MKINIGKLGNPLYIFPFAFLVAISLYHFRWSDLYPDLGLEVYLTFVFISFFFLIAGSSFQTKIERLSNEMKTQEIGHAYWPLFIIVALLALNILLAQNIPLFSSFFLESYRSKDEALPTFVGPLMMGVSIFFGTKCFVDFVSSKDFRKFIGFLITLLPTILFLQRGLLFGQLLSCAIAYAVCRRSIGIWALLKVFGLLIILVMMFGFLGEIRDSGGRYYRPITAIAGANESYYRTGLPESVFYVWVYITSPLANFMENIRLNITQHGGILSDWNNLLIAEMVPDLISKRFVDLDAFETLFPDYRIVETLNVGTIFTRPYSIAGWGGVVLLAAYLFALLLFIVDLVVRAEEVPFEYRVTLLALASTLSMTCLFDNMLPNSARTFPVVIGVLTLLWQRRLQMRVVA